MLSNRPARNASAPTRRTRRCASQSREEAEAAVATLLAWAGDDPTREGLRDTPARVAKAYEELFAGYAQDPADVLGTVFEDVGGYGEMVLVRDIPFYSHCEHHIAPFFGRRISPITPLAACSACPSSAASWIFMHAGCRRRRP